MTTLEYKNLHSSIKTDTVRQNELTERLDQLFHIIEDLEAQLGLPAYFGYNIDRRVESPKQRARIADELIERKQERELALQTRNSLKENIQKMRYDISMYQTGMKQLT